MRSLLQDLRFAARWALKKPAITLPILVTLALGIGVNTAIFSVLNGVLLGPLPYKDSASLVHVGYWLPDVEAAEGQRFSVRELEELQEATQTLAEVEEYHQMTYPLRGHGEPVQVEVGVVSDSFFETFGIEAILGRTFAPGEGELSAPPLMVLSYHLWQGHFGGDPEVVGRTVELDNTLSTIIGVLPELPAYPLLSDVWINPASCHHRSGERVISRRAWRFLSLFGRLAPGVSLEQAKSDLATLIDRWRQDYPELYPRDEVMTTATIVPVHEEITGEIRSILTILLATAMLVLLIVCVNVGNLNLALLLRREREILARAALGAGRGRLIRQMLTESLALSLVGGLLGLLLAHFSLRLLVHFASRFTVYTTDIRIDLPVLLFALGVSVLTGLAFSLVPVLRISRVNLAAGLRQGGGQMSLGGKGLHMRSALIALQVACSFVLLIGAGLMLRTLINLGDEDLGFEAENLTMMKLTLSPAKYRQAEDQLAFYEQLREKIEALPGTRSAAFGAYVPLGDDAVAIDGRIAGQDSGADREIASKFDVVSDGYFETAGIALVRGRTFTKGDDGRVGRVAIVNEAFARRYWPGQDPLGQRLQFDFFRSREWLTVVGVVADAKQPDLETEIGPKFYMPYAQTPGRRAYVIARTRVPPEQMLPQIVAAVREIDPNQPVTELGTLKALYGETLAPKRLIATLLSLLALLAFVITATGIGGVVASAVEERTRELGIRSALGAKKGDLLRLVLGQVSVLVVVGVLIGIVGAVWLNDLLVNLLYGVRTTDLATYVTVSLLLLAGTVVACLAPAWRAIKIDPIQTLRYE